MSLLLDALKRAEQAKRQQAAAAAGEVYPPLALQDEASDAAGAAPATAAAEVTPLATPEAPAESAFAAGLALEPVDQPSVSAAPVVSDEPVPSPEAAGTVALADVTPAPDQPEAQNVVEQAASMLAGSMGKDSRPVSTVEAAPDVPRPASTSALAGRFGAAAKAAVPDAAPVPERNADKAAEAPAAAPVAPVENKIASRPAPTPTPEAAQRVMANKPARKPLNRSVVLALCGLLLVGGSAGYLWWQMQPQAYVPDPALASDPLAGNMADASASANAVTAPGDAPTHPAGVKPVATSTVTSTAPKAQRAAGGTPVATMAAPATAPATRPGKQLEIRHDAPEEAVDATLQEGYRAYQAGDFASARAAYVRALQSNYRNRDALLGMAAIAVRQGRPEEAERFYRKQLEFDPLDEVAKAGLTGVARGLGTRERETALRNLGDTPASNAQTAVQLGNLYASEKRWGDAQQQYFRALTLEPGNPDHAFNLAVSLEHLDQPKLALDYYQKAQTLAAQRKPAFDPAELKSRIEALSQP